VSAGRSGQQRRSLIHFRHGEDPPQPGQTVGFKLTSVERELLVQSVPCPDAALEDKLKNADPGASNVNLTLPELRGLATCIQAQIKKTQRDRKLGVKLNRIWQRIVDIEKVFEEAH